VNITINWQAVSALCAVLTLALGLHIFVILALVRAEIRKLNGTYLRRELANAEFARINDHFDWLKEERAQQRKRDGLRAAVHP
jgi:hypothetical protein